LCDNLPAWTRAKSRQTGAKTYMDYEKLLADPNVEAIDITLPHYLHARVALAAIEARWKGKSMRREVQHFVRCIAQDTQPWVTGEDGREDVRVAVKCYESAKTGRPVEIGAI